MKYRSRLIVILAVLSIMIQANAFAGDFGAYYTRTESDPGGYSGRLGSYADLVVRIDAKRSFVFSHNSSYLPCLVVGEKKTYVKELVPRKGDGTATRPDKINRYSFVRLIEDAPDKVVVHWRYVADFKNVEWDGMVDEYFTIKPSGAVKRVVREGTPSRKDWDDPANRHVQILQLTEAGIKTVKYTAPKLSNTPGAAIKGAPIRKGTTQGAAALFRFDEGLKTNKDATVESVSGTACTVGGHKTVWRKGVSGSSLMFDGYYSKVTLPKAKAPAVKDKLTVQAWVALGAYPFNWGPIVQHSEFEKSGYYLGVDSYGHLGFMVHAGGKWNMIQASKGAFETDIELFRWYHVAATYDGTTMRLFIDGKPVATGEASGAITLTDRDLLVGLNTDKLKPTSPIRPQVTYPSIFGIDGLIDEVSIHTTALSAQAVAASFAKLQPSDQVKPDLEARLLPADPKGKKGESFGASYANLSYHAGFDNMWRVSDHPDIVVKFDRFPTRMVFWKGLRYSPAMVTENNKWGGDQSAETWSKPGGDPDSRYPQGCCEHMSDAQCRHSHVRIIENSPARIVIHWRYSQIDVRYKMLGRDDPPSGYWEDEYYTIYPDGVAIRWITIANRSWQESMFYNAPGTRPENNCHLKAYTMVNANGFEKTYSWANTPHEFPKIEKDPQIYLAGKPVITVMNLKSTYRPYYIYRADGAKAGIHAFAGEVREGYSRFPWWNHYPVSQAISDGRSAERSDRMTHSSLIGGGIPEGGSLMIGLTDQPAKSLLPQTKSWAQAPEITEFTGGISACKRRKTDSTYFWKQRQYPLAMAHHTMSFTLDASAESPIHNVCFKVTNWDIKNPARILVDGKPYEQIRQATILGTDGKYDLVAFVELKSQKPTKFVISKNLSPASAITLIDSTTRNGSFEINGGKGKPLSAAKDWDVWAAKGQDGGKVGSDHPTDGASSAVLDVDVAVCNMTAHTMQAGDLIFWNYDQIRYGGRILTSSLVYDNNGTITRIEGTEITRPVDGTFGAAYTVPNGTLVGKKLGIGFYTPKQPKAHQNQPVFDNIELKVLKATRPAMKRIH